MSAVSDYLLKDEQFAKIKSAFDESTTHSKDEVDAYNKSVKDLNDAVNTSNSTNNQLNQQRAELMDNWNNGENAYFDNNMPKYKD
jgi:ABC-type transporter Mla subunit MlaD